MAKKRVFLFPGFGASDLARVEDGAKLWWDIAVSPANGLTNMKLAANGKDPDPVVGKPMAVVFPSQQPWPAVKGLLDLQLDPDVWETSVVPYDFRLDILTQADTLATAIAANATPDNPVTLVGHSMGGLILVSAYQQLTVLGKQNLVRRIVTMGTPFQGSYLPIMWLIGALGTVQELTNVYSWVSFFPGINPLVWELSWLNMLALSWPAFYELFPFATGTLANNDPNRHLLYDAANYPASVAPSQAWLDYSRTVFQPVIQSLGANPPSWVMTTVAGRGIETPMTLASGNVPINLTNFGVGGDGDGVVAVESALKVDSARLTVPCNHTSLPLGLALTGKLALLITDERLPPQPAPPQIKLNVAIPTLVTDPPESDNVSQILCIGGG